MYEENTNLTGIVSRQHRICSVRVYHGGTHKYPQTLKALVTRSRSFISTMPLLCELSERKTSTETYIDGYDVSHRGKCRQPGTKFSEEGRTPDLLRLLKLSIHDIDGIIIHQESNVVVQE